ncbi:hypothetical protein C8J56DRAFT_1114824 [Mycena floridula]|nr:hypothetical protein C8J56DRAFT_1114824 [Mycena floridula]
MQNDPSSSSGESFEAGFSIVVVTNVDNERKTCSIRPLYDHALHHAPPMSLSSSNDLPGVRMTVFLIDKTVAAFSDAYRAVLSERKQTCVCCRWTFEEQALADSGIKRLNKSLARLGNKGPGIIWTLGSESQPGLGCPQQSGSHDRLARSNLN